MIWIDRDERFPSYAKRVIGRETERVGLSQMELNDAFCEAAALYGDITVENSSRSRLAAALAFDRNGSVLDVGGYISIYPVVLKLLGMKVTVLDSYPQRRFGEFERDRILGVLDKVHRRVGIDVIEGDVYSTTVGSSSFSVVSAFEVIEHFVDSPRPILEKISDALVSGGRFVCTVPNIASLGQRVRALRGGSVLPSYAEFWKSDCPFAGHRREMTMKEVHWMIEQAGFVDVHVSSTMITVPVAARKSLVRRLGENAMEILGPQSLRSRLIGSGRKP
jgi:SAM-dependent methyltransferase